MSRGDDFEFMVVSLLESDVSVGTGLDERQRGEQRRSAVADEMPIEVGSTKMNHEVSVPAVSTGRTVRTPAPGDVPWHEKVRSDQTTTGAD
jgi:hypothetical protein